VVAAAAAACLRAALAEAGTDTDRAGARWKREGVREGVRVSVRDDARDGMREGVYAESPLLLLSAYSARISATISSMRSSPYPSSLDAGWRFSW
jgi:hypothetical protein